MPDDPTPPPPAPSSEPDTPTPPPALPAQPAGAPGPDDGPDWKALARQWEKRAKDNSRAAAELEQLRQQSMTEQEKAVRTAERAGRQAAAAEYGAKLAAAEFKAAASAAGLDLGAAADLIDTTQFVAENGDVDADAITAAVQKLSALAPRGPGRSGADITGGSGDGPPSVETQIAEAQANGDWRAVMRLQNSKLAGLAGERPQ